MCPLSLEESQLKSYAHWFLSVFVNTYLSEKTFSKMKYKKNLITSHH